MTFIQRLVGRAGSARWFRWVGVRFLTPLDRLGSGRLPATTTLVTGLPLLYLTTTGRSTGRRRTVPLLFVELDTGGWAVVGSNFGGVAHPDWTANLEAGPGAVARIGSGPEVAVRARRATVDEVETLWPRFTAIWPGYDAYRERAAQRSIRTYVLEPTGGAVSSP